MKFELTDFDIFCYGLAVVCFLWMLWNILSIKKVIPEKYSSIDPVLPPIYSANRERPLYPKDYEWSKFIRCNLDKMYPIPNPKWNIGGKEHPQYFKIKGYDQYVISFHFTWYWNILEGKDADSIKDSFSIAGTSLRADYISTVELRTGIPIQNWYINFLKKEGYEVDTTDPMREKITRPENK